MGKGEKVGATPTAKKLKKELDKSIKEYLTKFKFDSISMLILSKEILSKYDPSILPYVITLNKNGKTVKVTKAAATKIKIPKLDFANKVGYFGADVWKNKNQPPNPSSKKSKKIILEGKLKELIKFHLERKHTLKWDVCVACKAIRAFIQWEFHQPAKLSKINYPSGSITDKAAKIKQKQAEIEIEIIKAAAESPVIKNITVKSLKEDDLLFKTEADFSFDEDKDDLFGDDSHGSD